MDIQERVLEAFRIEHEEHLEEIRGCLQRLAGGAGELDTQQVNHAFRVAHTLKGGARVCGLEPIERLAHALEDVFARMRDGALRCERATLSSIADALDCIEDWMSALLVGGVKPDLSPTTAGLKRLAGAAGESEIPATESIAEPCEVDPADDGERAVAGGDSVAKGPSLGATEVAEPAPVVTTGETLRVRAQSLDRLLQTADQLLTQSASSSALIRSQSDLCAGLHTAHATLASCRRELQHRCHGDISLIALDRLESDFAALTHAATRVELRCKSAIRESDSLARQLQGQLRAARMVPAESVFHGLRKSIRTLAGECGKQIELRCEGLDTLADRLVLQHLKFALMHLLRNAVDHGIETPETRTENGKPASGEIGVRVWVDRDRLHLRVEDDGRGLDSKSIMAAARDAAPISGDRPAESAEAARLILQPGVSTRGDPGRISGRGMGLCDVDLTVSRLQGSLTIRSEPGRGTSFEISTPVLIAGERVLIVQCAHQRVAVPTRFAQSLCRIPREKVRAIEGRAFVSLDGGTLRVVDLGSVLGAGDTCLSDTGEMSVLAVRSERGALALVVDRFVGEREAIISPMPEAAGAPPLVRGGIIMDDGTVCVVVNPDQALGDAPTCNLGQDAARVDVPSDILIVDDSSTTRTLERGILESEGFRVRVAVDGEQALKSLRERPSDLVITDVEMPRLGGFGLLERMKQDESLASIPVIIMSSQMRPCDLDRGMNLGADAYITKQRFDHDDLLATVRQFCRVHGECP